VFLLAGWLLGGSVGLGTVLVTVLVGEVVAIFFGIVSRVSKPANEVTTDTEQL
jgi:uncharacterized membrane protein YczE